MTTKALANALEKRFGKIKSVFGDMYLFYNGIRMGKDPVLIPFVLRRRTDLFNYLTVSRGYVARKDGFFLRAESFYNVASNMDELEAEVLEITKEGIKSVDYKDTEHFMVTKRFMDAPEKIIQSLLGEEINEITNGKD